MTDSDKRTVRTAAKRWRRAALGSVIVAGLAVAGYALVGWKVPDAMRPDTHGPGRARATDVAGKVVTDEGKPVMGQTVTIDSQSTTSDADGRFVIPTVNVPYDVTVVSPDKTQVVTYQGIHRRDPWLTLQSPDDDVQHTRSAKVRCTFSASTSYELTRESVRLHFSSARVDADQVILGRGRYMPAPTSGELVVTWDGPETVEGELFGFQLADKAGNQASGIARYTLVLRNGETKAIDLRFDRAPVVRRPGAEVLIDGQPESIVVHHHYRRPGSGWVSHGYEAYRPGEFDTLDLSGYGLTLCAEAFNHNPYLLSKHRLCEMPFNKPVVLELFRPPSFSGPDWGTTAAPGLRFTWSAVPHAVYELELAPDDPTVDKPRFRIVTASTTTTWVDLQHLGVAFPKPPQSYGAIIAAWGPYATIDDAVGPEGLGAPLKREFWSARSQTLSVPVQEPLGAEEAACQYPYATAIECDPPSKTFDGPGEQYMLSAINDKIRFFPAFAKEIGIHCVRDCAGARAFLNAYQKYVSTHPDFDADSPLEPTPPPPPPPGLHLPGVPRYSPLP